VGQLADLGYRQSIARIVEMSVAGLSFGSDQSTAPLETKSGSYIYHGDAAHYHDSEFRTLLRIKLFDSKKDVESSPTGRSSEPTGPDSEVEAGISPHPRPGHRDDGAPASAGPSPKGDDTGRDRSALVNKIVEGLRHSQGSLFGDPDPGGRT